MGKEELETRISSALKEAYEHFPVHKNSPASPYYGFEEINTHGAGKYHVAALRYHRSMFEKEPDAESFQAALVKFYAGAKGLDVYSASIGKIFRIVKSKSPGSEKADAVRIRIRPEYEMEDGKRHVGSEPVLTATLDTKAKKMFFSYRKEDPEAEVLLRRFVLSYIDGKKQVKAFAARDPDSTVAYAS